MFNKNVSDAKVELIVSPTIRIHTKALDKMASYTDICEDEIGWLGTATRDKFNEIIIHDMMLFEQEVHATTTEISPEGLAEFGEALLLREDGIDVWNNMRVWGHSHVNMQVNPSGQDDSQMATFGEQGVEWFIRIITNKMGDLRIDLYDFENGLVYSKLPWVEILSPEMQEIQEHIDGLKTLISNEKGKVFQLEHLEAESDIKEKVSKLVNKYRHPGVGVGTYGGYGNIHKPITVVNSKQTKKNTNEDVNSYDPYDPYGVDYYGQLEHELSMGYGFDELNDDIVYSKRQDVIKEDSEITSSFFHDELIDIAMLKDEDEVLEYVVVTFQLNDYYTLRDITRIIRIARQYLPK